MLEDEAGDIIRKARRGQHLALETVAEAAGMAPGTLRALERLDRTIAPEQAHALAAVLGLAGPKLALIAERAYQPRPQPQDHGVVQVRSLLVSQPDGFTANCYLFGFQDTEEAIIVDPGAEPERILGALEDLGWKPRYVALTHGHADHVNGLAGILDEWAASVLAAPGDLEMIGLSASRVHVVADGEVLPLGRHWIRAVHTPGHTLGGVSYLMDGCCFVGDALFAGSIGNANVPQNGYRMLRESVWTKLLSLAPETVIYPGHGPASTVAEERAANPFFPIEG